MSDLFGNNCFKSAILSTCGTYRYQLDRTWSDDRPACFIMLNPSTADAENDDPTIRRCIDFAQRWECGGIKVVNLFALRSTDPKVLVKVADPIGPDNDLYIRAAILACYPVVCAWGAEKFAYPRGVEVNNLILRLGLPWGMCLGMTRERAPRHPLYVPANTELIPFK